MGNYWNNGAFFGFGMGATSYVGNARVQRPRNLSKYKAWLDEKQGQPESDHLEDQLLEHIMLRLRLKEGLLLSGLDERFNCSVEKDIESALEDYIARDLVRNEAGTVSLSDPEGFLISNSIISDVFS